MPEQELVDTNADKRYVRRDTKGEFKGSVDIGRSLYPDKHHTAKKEAKQGEGDRGDHHAKHSTQA